MRTNCAVALFFAVMIAACSPTPKPPELPSASLDPSLASLIQTSRQAVLNAPISGEAWGKLGEAFHTADFFTEAQACYEKALELQPQSPKWPHLLGLLQLQNQPLTAMSNLQRAVSLDPAKADASRLHLARALIEQ